MAGLLSYAVAGAVQGAAQGGAQALLIQMEEEKQKRIAENSANLARGNAVFESQLRDEQRKGIAAEVEAVARDNAAKAGGLLAQSADDAYVELAKTDPEGAELGRQAVANAKAEGRYDAEPTLEDKAMAQAQVTGNYVDLYKMSEASKSRYATLEARMRVAEMQNALGLAKMDAVTQVAMAKLETAAMRASSNNATPAALAEFRGIVSDINTALKNEGKPTLTAQELKQIALGSKAVDTTKQTYEVDPSGKRVLVSEEVNRKSLPGTQSATAMGGGQHFVWDPKAGAVSAKP